MVLLSFHWLQTLLQHTTLYKNYKNNKEAQQLQQHENTNLQLNRKLDHFLGLLFALCLLYYHAEINAAFLEIPHTLIAKLHQLLHDLQDKPIGLKLNVQLNNFLHDCYDYHIDLWQLFLEMLEPLLIYLYAAFGLLGWFGLSYQLALLSDVIAIAGLHSHCLYVYSAVLYRVNMQGLRILWRLMRGKRYNVLTERIEHYSYKNRQLYLATIYFSILIFLMPTILVYYVTFGTVRCAIIALDWLLQFLASEIMRLPLDALQQKVLRIGGLLNK